MNDIIRSVPIPEPSKKSGTLVLATSIRNSLIKNGSIAPRVNRRIIVQSS